jgi:hypothetical protein
MSVQPSTFTLTGGLDLVSPPIAIPQGAAVAGCNYIPDDQGYARIGGYERYDGNPQPSASENLIERAARRANISAVPGVGAVNGVWIFHGNVYAFRDTVGGSGAMWKDSAAGWVQIQTFKTLAFMSGTAEYPEGAIVAGDTSGATATVRRTVLQYGAYDGTAMGYLSLSDITGTFVPGETVTGGGGSAVASATLSDITIEAGGTYRFENYNFYGAVDSQRMYFVNGNGPAFEFDGEFLHPIYTSATGVSFAFTDVIDQDLSTIITAGGDTVSLAYPFDRPQQIGVFAEHLWLGYESGSVLISSTGEPMEYRAVTGAGEIGIGYPIVGFLANAQASFVIYCRGRIFCITGTSTTDFVKDSVSSGSGAFPDTMAMLDQPIYLDDGGIRKMSTTQAFGDWKLGTVSFAIAPLLDARLNAGNAPVASCRVKQRTQYRLFWPDGTGLCVYFGRKNAEIMPFKIPVAVSCACSGQTDETNGKERIFIGGEDGYVYEMEAGPSFDGAPVPAFITFAWNHMGGPRIEKRFFMSEIEVDAPDTLSVGVTYQLEYNRSSQVQPGASTAEIEAGTRAITEIDNYANLDFTQPVMGKIYADLEGLGTNLAITLYTEATNERAHSLTAMTINFAPQKLKR